MVLIFFFLFALQALVLCFRLHFTKDSTTINTAAATIKQLVSAILDRVVAEDKIPTTGQNHIYSSMKIKSVILIYLWLHLFYIISDFCMSH